MHSLSLSWGRGGGGGHKRKRSENCLDYMAKLLSKSGYHLTTSAERDLVTDIKEKFCYVSLNYESESASPKSYTLPDDSQLTVTSERFRCPEALFKPSMAEIGSIGT